MIKNKQVFNNKLQHFKNAYVHGGRRELCVQKITKYMKENACLWMFRTTADMSYISVCG